MNIFYLHPKPTLCAQYHTDKHVVKMPLEYAQLLCTAHRLVDGTESTKIKNGRRNKVWTLQDYREDTLYGATHRNHPSALWARESKQNYQWLYSLFVEICKEYTYRYDKTHLCETKLKATLKQCPHNIGTKDFTPPVPAMPIDYKDQALNVLDAYHTYYVCDKAHLLTWKKRKAPPFIEEAMQLMRF